MGIKTTCYRKRNEFYSKFYSKNSLINYCNDISDLFKKLHQVHNTGCCLSTATNTYSLKSAVLLHNRNEKLQVIIAHAVNTKETYKGIVKFMEYINCKNYEWKVCSDLKTVAMLHGMQGSYTQNCSFVFEIAAEMLFIFNKSIGRQ